MLAGVEGCCEDELLSKITPLYIFDHQSQNSILHVFRCVLALEDVRTSGVGIGRRSLAVRPDDRHLLKRLTARNTPSWGNAGQ